MINKIEEDSDNSDLEIILDQPQARFRNII